MANREGQPNPDAAIVEAALEKVPMPDIYRDVIWRALNHRGESAHQLAGAFQAKHPAFAQALREGIAARRGQRFGGHGGKP